jgi:hypothetical protein
MNNDGLVHSLLLNGLTLMSNCPDAVWGFLYAYRIQTPRPATNAMMNRIPTIPEMLMGTLWSPVNNQNFLNPCYYMKLDAILSTELHKFRFKEYEDL